MKRDAKAQDVWKQLNFENRRPALAAVQLGSSQYDLSSPCVVIGGRNGVGKTRVLRQIGKLLGPEAVFIDLHHLSEQAMILLRSRGDEEGAVEDAGTYSPSSARLDDLTRIIGRRYSSVQWANLELVPSEPEVAESFKWSNDQPSVPYFEVQHDSQSYSSTEMGLGEFTMHFLFWIIEQHRDKQNLTLILDEPDAFLPPVGVRALLHALLAICVERRWQLVLSTHSDEMIRSAVEHDAFVLLSKSATGDTTAQKTNKNLEIASFLLSRPPVSKIVYCEDESASYMIDSMIRRTNTIARKSVAVAWGSGNGDLVSLRSRLPNPSKFEVQFAFVFDGDQWDKTESVAGAWPARFLPTGSDPDEMFRVAHDPAVLASRLAKPVEEIQAFLESIDGEENHDWTNKLANEFGRAQTLTILSDLWVDKNRKSAEEFCMQLNKPDEFLHHSSQISLKAKAEHRAGKLKYGTNRSGEKGEGR